MRPPSLYTVKSGDTLSALAQRHHLSQRTLQQLNPDLDPNRIRPGQRLRILSHDTRPILIQVGRHDTLSMLAHLFDTSVERLMDDNQLRTTVLHQDQQLVRRYHEG